MVEEQALDRVHRIGQTKEVTTVRYIVNRTLEDVCRFLSLVYLRVRLKARLETRLANCRRSYQNVRHQQIEKRNLAEQAFHMVQKQGDWLQVSLSLKHTVDIFSNQLLQRMAALVENPAAA